MDANLLSRITCDPAVMVGKPVIRGTRIPVAMILEMLAQGISEAEILQDYPKLRTEDLRAALAYAAQVTSQESILPLVAGA